MRVMDDLAQYSSLPPGDVHEWTTSVIEDLDSSILFVHAPWSGPSYVAFTKLTARLASAPGSPRLFVRDIDTLSADTKRTFGVLRGVGETFWIRDGHVVASLRDYAGDGWTESFDINNGLLDVVTVTE